MKPVLPRSDTLHTHLRESADGACDTTESLRLMMPSGSSKRSSFGQAAPYVGVFLVSLCLSYLLLEHTAAHPGASKPVRRHNIQRITLRCAAAAAQHVATP